MKWKRRLPSNLFALALAGGLFLFPSGCGSFEDAGTVSGTVHYKGQPLTEGSVSFVNDNGQVASGAIDQSGSYVVAHVPVGAAKVTVQVASAMPPMSFIGARKTAHASGTGVKIPLRYCVPSTSGLQHSVTKGKQTFDIDLKE
jgi:hypothetical protein